MSVFTEEVIETSLLEIRNRLEAIDRYQIKYHDDLSLRIEKLEHEINKVLVLLISSADKDNKGVEALKALQRLEDIVSKKI